MANLRRSLHEEEDDDLQEPPPSYEATQASRLLSYPDQRSLLGSLVGVLSRSRTSSPSKSPRASEEGLRPMPIRVIMPSTKHVRCHCNRDVDTSSRSSKSTLPPGQVECKCGYIVSSDGHSWHPMQYTTRAPKTCSCGTMLPDPLPRLGFDCACGATFQTNGAVVRHCQKHGISSQDAKNVACACGRRVDTTSETVMRHGKLSTTDGHSLSRFDWRLIDGGWCPCGKMVRRDGQTAQEHTSRCCSVLSKTPASGTQLCTCAS